MDKKLLDLFSKDLSKFVLKHIKGIYVPETEEVVDKENLISLIQAYIFEADQVEEKFVVKVKGPEEDEGLDRYLKNLATYVNIELRNGNDEGIDIDQLRQLAYNESVPLIPFEEMLLQASKWEDYFSYLLVKDERKNIKADQIEKAKDYSKIFMTDSEFKDYYEHYANNSVNESSFPEGAPAILNLKRTVRYAPKGKIVHNYTYAKGENLYLLRDVQHMVMNSHCAPHMLSVKLDFIILDTFTKTIKTINFDVIDNIVNFPDTFEAKSLDLEVAIANSLLKGDWNDGYKVEHYYAVSDDMGRVYNFKVSDKTIEKSVQKLNKIVRKYAWHRKNKSWFLPYEFATKSVTI